MHAQLRVGHPLTFHSFDIWLAWYFALSVVKKNATKNGIESDLVRRRKNDQVKPVRARFLRGRAEEEREKKPTTSVSNEASLFRESRPIGGSRATSPSFVKAFTPVHSNSFTGPASETISTQTRAELWPTATVVIKVPSRNQGSGNTSGRK